MQNSLMRFASIKQMEIIEEAANYISDEINLFAAKTSAGLEVQSAWKMYKRLLKNKRLRSYNTRIGYSRLLWLVLIRLFLNTLNFYTQNSQQILL